MSFYIQNASTGLVLDIKESQRTHSAQIVMFPYHGGPNQLWTYQNNMIYSKLNGMVLNVRSANGDIITYPCHNGESQKWYFDPDSTIRNANGKVLDVNEGGRGPGTKLIIFQKHGGENQRFNMVPVSAPAQKVATTVIPVQTRNLRRQWTKVSHVNAFGCGSSMTISSSNTSHNIDNTPFYIQNSSTGLVLDIKKSQRTHSAPIVMFTYHGGPNQLWTYKNNMIYSKLNGMVLDVSGFTGQLVTYPAHGGSNQKWYFDPDMTIRCGNGKVLDVGGTNFGLITFPKHGGENQQFCKVPTGPHACPGHALPPGCCAKGSQHFHQY